MASRVGAMRGLPAPSPRGVHPALLRCSWARWAAGVAGASAWLAPPMLPGLRKFGMRCTIPWLAFRPVSHPTFCRVLSPSAPLCFLSGRPTLHSAPAPRVALPAGTLQGVQSWSAGSRFLTARPGISGYGYLTTQLALEGTLRHFSPRYFLGNNKINRIFP